MAEGGSRDCEKQKNEIGELLKASLKKGDTWYLLDTKWFKQWKKYVGFDNWDTSFVGEDTAHPGPVDNSPLLKESSNNELKEHLIEELDYVLVPEEAWNKLHSWYGLQEGQESLPRKVIEQGMFVKHCKVEVYLMDLKLCQNSDLENVTTKPFSRADTIDVSDEDSYVTKAFSRTATIENIEKEMRKLFQVEEETEVRLWNKYMSNTYEHLNKPENTVQDAGLYQGQVIVIEKQNKDGTWPRQTKTTNSAIHNNSLEIDSYSSTSTSNRATSSYGNTYGSSGYGSSSSSYFGSSYESGYHRGGGGSSPGLCGLSNLGNTCFMNSAIQGMSNVPKLTEYFLSEEWLNELNYDNPLGMKGEIAKSYAELIRNIWSGKFSYTVPRNFKLQVGRFAPQFSGYQQQDSQELMAFLLDGLHEDLNRIKKKPYIEIKEGDGLPDEEVAKEAWETYKKRNDSIIVDIFHGLLKSTLVCPECNKVSVTFDPFCYLSLPLPIKKERNIEVFFVPYAPMSKPRQYKLTVPKMGVVTDLCKALSKLASVPASKLMVTDVYNHRFHKVFSPEDSLNHILDKDDIFVYEIPENSSENPDILILPVYMREQKSRPNHMYNAHVSTQLFGQPLLVAVPRETCTYDVLYNCVLDKMGRYVRIPEANVEWWKSSKHENDVSNQNGEVEMNDGDEEEEDGPTENEDKSAQEEQEDCEEDTVNEADRQHRLFTFCMVNSYGSAEVEAIRDDGKPIRFQNRPYVAIDWHPKAKELFYDEKAAEDYEQDESVNQRHGPRKHTIQLGECLDLYTTTEKLGQDDPWYCPRCKKHQQATKKFDLWSLPEVLVIHLKRFSYNRYWRDKLDTFVEYPTRGLNLRKYVINSAHGPVTYDLIAVSNHYGGMGGGHYTAYARSKDDGHWYHFDDSSVSSCTEENVVTKAGYVLVYQRRDTVNNGPVAAPTRTSVPSTEVYTVSSTKSPSDAMSTNGECSSEDEMDIN